MVPAVILSVIAFVAGKPVHVVCDASLNGHYVASAAAWTAYGGDTIYAMPYVCDGVKAKIGTPEFADSLGTFIHESAHARGYRSESCAELIADLGIYQVLRDYYGVPFFSTLSDLTAAQLLQQTRDLPADYQPALCWSSGYR